MADQLFVNGKELDLEKGSTIGITVQSYNPMVPDQVKYSFTNRMRAPMTPANKIALNYLDHLGVVSSFYKSRQPARFIRNGLEVIPDGYVLVLGVKDNFFELALYSGFLDLFSILEDKLLADVSYTDVNTGWNPADYDAVRTTFVGTDIGKIFSWVVDHGYNITAGVNVVPLVGYGYKQMLEKILTQAGYTWNWGNLDDVPHGAADYKFKMLALLQGNKDHAYNYTDKFKDTLEFSAASSVDQNFNPGGAASAKIVFDTIKKPCAFWSTPFDTYTVANGDTANHFAQVTFYAHLKVTATLLNFNIDIYKNGVALQTIVVVAGTTVTIDLQSTAGGGTSDDIKNGDTFWMQVYQPAPGVGNCKIWADSTFYSKFIKYSNSATSYVYFNQLLPEITQLQLMKDFLFRFGQIPKQVNKQVTFKSIVEIISDVTNLNNWTGKRDKTRFDESTLSLNELAQSNVYKYGSKEDGLSEFGKGSFTLDDATLALEKVTTSVFDNAQDVVTQGIKCASVPLGAASPFAQEIGKRLLMVRYNTATDAPSVAYNGIARTTYLIGCFNQGVPTVGSTDDERGLDYQRVLDNKYNNGSTTSKLYGFLTRLKNAKWVIRYYNLGDVDIATLDPHKMIFDDGNYFLFPKIFNYLPGVVTKVQMLKI